MYKVCIFDLDGTLTDTLDSITYSVNETLKELHLSSITREQCREFIGSGAAVLIEKSLRASGDENAQYLEKAKTIYKRIFGEFCTYHVTPYDGVEDMLRSLKSRGLKLAVLSNKPHEQTVKVVHSIFGEEVFDFVQGQQEGVPRKPDPALLKKLMHLFYVSKDEVIYVGDSDVDMKTGKAADVYTVGVSWGFRTEDILKSHGADLLIHRPEELITIIEDKE